ncbi:hypothetical protein [Methylobacterium oryzihabitans]|uniref:Uncharacterized protein n=1 Tax=Methylobacterium oryzihabitans TaxID=2499852 RepID=A0A437NX04_9HYPH|nr:hypothetical protein [Methylobacterium oryzihabitans]RVU14536.1 hypothetical protein EOE48_22615 [Methylobacterium oryzihabitans]
MRSGIILAAAFGLSLAGAATAQTAGGLPPSDALGAPGPGTGGTRTGDRGRPPPVNVPGGANPSNSSVPGTTPGVWIGGSPTGGPPGTGGTAGGAGLDN